MFVVMQAHDDLPMECPVCESSLDEAPAWWGGWIFCRNCPTRMVYVRGDARTLLTAPIRGIFDWLTGAMKHAPEMARGDAPSMAQRKDK